MPRFTRSCLCILLLSCLLQQYMCEDEEIHGTNLLVVFYSTALEEFFIMKPPPYCHIDSIQLKIILQHGNFP